MPSKVTVAYGTILLSNSSLKYLCILISNVCLLVYLWMWICKYKYLNLHLLCPNSNCLLLFISLYQALETLPASFWGTESDLSWVGKRNNHS